MAGAQAKAKLGINPHESEQFSQVKGGLNAAGEQVSPLGTDFFKQLLGIEEKVSPASSKNREIELKVGESIDLKNFKQKSSEKRIHAAAGIDYHREIVQGSERANKEEKKEIAQTIQEIKVELQRLVSSSAILQQEFKEVYMTETPKTPGKYHQNFFEWVLIVIQQARMKVEDSGAWLSTMKGKKGKQSYWGMFKKHGTSFGLSNERNIATQTG